MSIEFQPETTHRTFDGSGGLVSSKHFPDRLVVRGADCEHLRRALEALSATSLMEVWGDSDDEEDQDTARVVNQLRTALHDTAAQISIRQGMIEDRNNAEAFLREKGYVPAALADTLTPEDRERIRREVEGVPPGGPTDEQIMGDSPFKVDDVEEAIERARSDPKFQDRLRTLLREDTNILERLRHGDLVR